MVLIIEPLDSSRHHRELFCCGQDSLDNYIRKQASQDLKNKVAIVFVLVDSPNTDVIAYYTLSAYTIELTDLSESFAKKTASLSPSTCYIARSFGSRSYLPRSTSRRVDSDRCFDQSTLSNCTSCISRCHCRSSG